MSKEPEPIKNEKRGTWRLQYTVQGKRYSITGKTRNDVSAQYKQELKDLANDRWIPPKQRKLERQKKATTVEDMFHRLPALRRWKPSTQRGYTSIWNNDVAPQFKGAPIAEVKRRDVAEWWSQLVRDHPERHKRNYDAYRLLSAIFNEAIEAELIEASPVRVKAATKRPASKDRPLVELEDLEKVLAHLPKHYRVPVLFAAGCAMRIGEWSALTRADIDDDGEMMRVFVCKQVQDKDGGGVEVVEGTKTGRNRWVTVPDSVAVLVRKHMDQYSLRGKHGLLFPNSKGEPMNRRRFNRTLREACKSAGVREFSSHDLRHLGATEFARSGATVRELQERLGHSTVESAMRYQHATLVRDREIANRVQLPTVSWGDDE